MRNSFITVGHASVGITNAITGGSLVTLAPSPRANCTNTRLLSAIASRRASGREREEAAAAAN